MGPVGAGVSGGIHHRTVCGADDAKISGWEFGAFAEGNRNEQSHRGNCVDGERPTAGELDDTTCSSQLDQTTYQYDFSSHPKFKFDAANHLHLQLLTFDRPGYDNHRDCDVDILRRPDFDNYHLYDYPLNRRHNLHELLDIGSHEQQCRRRDGHEISHRN
jgi:hypothetical protein